MDGEEAKEKEEEEEREEEIEEKEKGNRFIVGVKIMKIRAKESDRIWRKKSPLRKGGKDKAKKRV